jgi:hypothetical protein
MTHDLYRNTLLKLGIEVSKIEICDLRDNTYFALIYLIRNKKEMTIDARPSDAIAIALRSDAPIYVDDQVIEKSKAMDLGAQEQIKTEEGKKWTEILESLKPEDFGKYKM